MFYTNALFLLGSIVPGTFTTSRIYQKGLFYLYIFFNGFALALNYLDFVYYRFNLSRLTSKVFEVLENETNLIALSVSFLIDYWYVFLLYFLSLFFWVKIYKILIIKQIKNVHLSSYIGSSIVLFFLVSTTAVIGIRGDWRHSTRPITLIHAMEKVDHPTKADVVLNSVFTLIRTYGKNSFKA